MDLFGTIMIFWEPDFQTTMKQIIFGPVAYTVFPRKLLTWMNSNLVR